MTDLLYNLLVTLSVPVAWRLRSQARGAGALVWLPGSVALGLALVLGGDPLGLFRLVSWWLFLILPATCLLDAWRRRSGGRLLRLAAAGLIWAVAADAFLWEPQALVVTHYRIASPRLSDPVRVVVLADIQTDAPGSYEARVLAAARAADPDLVLFAGDYIQVDDPVLCRAAVGRLNELLRAADLHAPLGLIAVQGNIDRGRPWAEVFRGTDVQVLAATATLDLGPLTVTALDVRASCDAATSVPGRPGFHLVLGHAPNFALGDIDADLLLAGHTHGGQVRLPGIGPLLTYAAIPRAWAAGRTDLGAGRTLIVSRGIGLERGQAPRLRFLCRPELLVLDLVPSEPR